MKTKKEMLYEFIIEYSQNFKMREDHNPRIETAFLSEQLNMQRSNVSTALNQLVKEGKITKHPGRPVLYSLVEDEERQMDDHIFSTLIGYDKSLQEPIRIAKAALHYPGKTPCMLVISQKGSGTKTFAQHIYKYACSTGILSRNTFYHIIDCSIYDEKSYLDAFLQTTGSSQQNSFFILSNLSSISKLTMTKILDTIYSIHKKSVFILQTSDHELATFLKEQISFQIKLPSLDQRCASERYQFIEQFFQMEASNLNKQIYVNYGLMQGLMLYLVKDNVEGLKRNIQYGVANGLARQRKAKELKLDFGDFEEDVRKGLLYVNDASEEIREFFKEHRDYIFSKAGTKYAELEKSDIYQRVDKMKQIVCKSANSLEADHFMIHNIETELYEYLMMLNKGMNEQKFQTIVSQKLADMVKAFMQQATKRFNQTYPKEIYYGICLHLNNIIIQENHKQRISNQMIMNVIEKYDDEYFFVKQFIKTVEEQFRVKLSLDETVFITLFMKISLEKCTKKEVVTVVAMHGERVASEIINTVQQLMPVKNVYAFDMPLNQNIEESYEQLKQALIQLNQGKGIILIYDMGSLKIMAEQISEETKLNIKTFELPLPLMTLSCAQKSEEGKELDEVYHALIEEYGANPKSSTRDKTNVVITLSLPKEKKSASIKRSLLLLKDSKDYEMIDLDIEDKNLLVQKINEISYLGNVIGIVGTYNPEIFNLKFIDYYYISQVSSIKELFHKEEDNFDLFQYLHEQYSSLSREDLEVTLIPFITKLETIYQIKLKEDDRIGLFIHMTGIIDKKIKGNGPVSNFNVSDIILHHEDELKQMKDALLPIECYFSIHISDGDAATILKILLNY